MQNIDISGVGSMCCTWRCTDDIVGITVPRDQFSISHFEKKFKISNSKFQHGKRAVQMNCSQHIARQAVSQDSTESAGRFWTAQRGYI